MEDEIYDKRAVWLEGYGLKESDVLEDEDGEFILYDLDSGHPSDDGYNVKWYRTNLPKNLQRSYHLRKK